MVRTLSNVHHIPNLKRNLISLGTLESNESKYLAEDGVLKISKGALVLMKGEKHVSLYILQGSTVIGLAIVNTHSLKTLLNYGMLAWELGHMSKKGMKMLSK